MDVLLAKTLHGLEDVLTEELSAMGALNIVKGRRSVSFEGDREMMYRANYCLRTALSILKPLHSFGIVHARDLYDRALKYPWEDTLGVGQTFMVVPVVHSSLFNHTAYPALLLKDAIADRFRKKMNRRPSVDTRNPDIVINCHIKEKEVNLSLDSSLAPLFKRNYRQQRTEAPLNEVLAAGILMISGWDMKTPLLDPMCGSGTIAIEAALMSRNIPPGKFRKHFGFMNWPDYDNELFRRICAEEEAKICPPRGPVFCSDISAHNIRVARSNIRKAGLEKDIRSSVSDFLESKDPEQIAYTIIMNPPYGERLDDEGIEDLYAGIGERLKHAYPGSTAWLLSSNTEALKRIGLRPAAKYSLFNGKIEVKLLKYELYKGSKKAKK
ncbi:MAG: THUMP domain-containing protein [Bacteroidales bacterium]|jgi:putative N6-adenine-specific DNA methylase|nr:THUMP domain-containing protein [Bacteroidales bacterium]